MTTTLSLAQIPLEIIEQALWLLHPTDVASFAQSCRMAREIVYNPQDSYFWQRLLLSHFDDPRKAALHAHLDNKDVEWKTLVQKRTTAEKWMLSESPNVLTNWVPVLQAIIQALEQVPALGDQESLNITWVSKLVSRTPPLPLMHDISDEERALLARLRVYMSLHGEGLDRTTNIQLRMTRERTWQGSSRVAKLDAIRRESRAMVYNLQNYTQENSYGPFYPIKDGQRFPHINWSHFESCVNVVTLNVFGLDNGTSSISHRLRENFIKPPMGLEYTRPNTAPKSLKARPDDWAGVEGKWRRLVCFMDYRDLFAYNYTNYAGGPLNPSFFDQVSFREATRLVTMDLHITSIGDREFEPDSECTPVTQSSDTIREGIDSIANAEIPIPKKRQLSDEYPDIYFTGRAVSSPGYDALLTGSVRMADDGTIRWTWMLHTVDAGVSWSSVGVQIGHKNSAAGVVGTWTGANHDDDDPAGPFWMWKVADDTPTPVYEP